MQEAKGKHEPVRESVHLDCPIDEAFRLFTEHIGEWWPLASYSLFGEEAADCVLEPWTGGRLFERSLDGEERQWGAITVWNPPERIEFTWHPGGCEDPGQHVEINFLVEADGTRVTVLHSGWHLAYEPVALSMTGAHLWPEMLCQAFAEFAAGSLVLIG